VLECKMEFYASPDELPDAAFYPLGGFEPSPNWAEYVLQYDEDLWPYLEAARQWALGLEAWPGASDFAGENYLAFSDGGSIVFSWRAFGDFLQAVAGRREGYLEYYLNSPNLLFGKTEFPPDQKEE